MKKNLLLTFCFAIAALATFAQTPFKSRNLAVYRYGDGTALAAGVRVPVFIDEYSPTGVLVQSIPLSRTASGTNYGFEGLGLNGTTGTYEVEGFPVLSRDGSVLSIIGYDPAQTGQYVIAAINAAGAINATTLISDDIASFASPTGTNNIGAPRSAVIDGNAVYFNGYNAGVRYTTLGSSAASTRISVSQNAPRVLTIGETLLNNVAGIKLFAPSNGTNLPNNNLTTTSATFATTPNFPGAATPVGVHQAIAIRAYSRTFVYVLDDNGGAPLIRKYRSNAGGTDWLSLGSASVPVTTKSIAARFDETGVYLYFTTLGTVGNLDSKLYALTDAFTSADNDTKQLSGTPVLLATATANTNFRGVTMTPGTSVLPVDLSKFEGKAVLKTNVLNWTTASEKNSSHFEILRSFDGKDFQKIGSVKAATNSSSTKDYTFTDADPLAGVNYYLLQQFDNDGKSTTYGPVAVTSLANKTNFTIYASTVKSAVEVTVYSASKQQGKFKVVNTAGQVLQEQTVSLEKGYTKLTLPASYAKIGVHIAVLNSQSEVITKKFIWQP